MKDFYGQLNRSKPRRQKFSLLVPLGLHGLFVGFSTIIHAVGFFCHSFCTSRTFGTLFFPCCKFTPKELNPLNLISKCNIIQNNLERKDTSVYHHIIFNIKLQIQLLLLFLHHYHNK